ncbi:hypothetical protein [Streptomyces sp. SID6137]|uniref:hypothetical protein n=1 Tax=Streptomyces sp. SID6137 TaxID=2690319 RepID=UPI00136B85BE|nr:hypothetical protein [Streptomyces sp. SID6137]
MSKNFSQVRSVLSSRPRLRRPDHRCLIATASSAGPPERSIDFAAFQRAPRARGRTRGSVLADSPQTIREFFETELKRPRGDAVLAQVQLGSPRGQPIVANEYGEDIASTCTEQSRILKGATRPEYWVHGRTPSTINGSLKRGALTHVVGSVTVPMRTRAILAAVPASVSVSASSRACRTA